MRRKIRTAEEKAAQQLANIVSDVRLNLDEVGIYLATYENVSVRRLVEIVETAEYEREQMYDRQHIPYLF